MFLKARNQMDDSDSQADDTWNQNIKYFDKFPSYDSISAAVVIDGD